MYRAPHLLREGVPSALLGDYLQQHVLEGNNTNRSLVLIDHEESVNPVRSQPEERKKEED